MFIEVPPSTRNWPNEWDIPDREWLVFPTMSSVWHRLGIIGLRRSWPKEKFANLYGYRAYHTEKELSHLANGGVFNSNGSWESYMLTNISDFGWNSVHAPRYYQDGAIQAISWIAYDFLTKRYPLNYTYFAHVCKRMSYIDSKIKELTKKTKD